MACVVGGVEQLPRLIDEHGTELAARLELPVEVIRELRMIPSYYLRYYYAHDEVVAELLRDGTRAEEVQRIEAELLELYRDPALVTKPALLEQRGGAYYSEAAVALLSSLLGQVARSRSCRERAQRAGPSASCPTRP